MTLIFKTLKIVGMAVAITSVLLAGCAAKASPGSDISSLKAGAQPGLSEKMVTTTGKDSLASGTRASGTDSSPQISGEAGITIDMDKKKVLYAKNISRKMYPASTTKLMTALLLAENKKPDTMFTYSRGAKAQEANKLDLPVGAKISAANAMDALLLFSANDSAYLIAENVAGTSESFANLMNKRAKQLGLKNTHFVNSNGLHNDNHFTTAYDLTVIAREAYKYPWIRTTLQKRTSAINALSQTPANGAGARDKAGNLSIPVENTNKLLGKSGNVGGKTGYTSMAGKNLVAIYERDGRRIVGVVMKSKDDETLFDDMQRIIDWSYTRE